jgi:cell division protein FtsN
MARRFGPVQDASDDAKEDLPWLESAPETFDDEDERVVPRGVLIGGLALFLLALAGLVGFIYFKVASPGGSAQEAGPVDPDKLPLIAAPKGPVRVRPSEPGGMQVDNPDLEVNDVAAGSPVTSPPQLAEAPEQPMARDELPSVSEPPQPIPPVAKPAPPKPAPVVAAPPPAPKPAPPKPVVAAAPPPVAAPSPAGGVFLQLGAFSERARAERAWSAASASFASVGSLGHSITAAGPAKFRLRAGPVSSVEEGQRICGELKAQGQACIVAK